MYSQNCLEELYRNQGPDPQQAGENKNSPFTRKDLEQDWDHIRDHPANGWMGRGGGVAWRRTKNRHKLKRIWELHNTYTGKCRGEEAMNQQLDDPDLNMIISLTRIMTINANDLYSD